MTARPDARLDGEEIIAHCREHLAPYKAPKRVYVLDRLPTDPQGKVLKRQLRESHAGGAVEPSPRGDGR